MFISTPEFDAFAWSSLSRSSLPVSETCCLDYESAREATPRWYGVSSGNGNDGVSHTWPDYYVRTNDPWRLAELAVVDQFKRLQTMMWAQEVCEVDGEADYTISATIYEGPNEETEFGAAWMIVEVFPLDEAPTTSAASYQSLDEAFSKQALAMVEPE